jgi:hypothetical protein
MTTPFIYQIEVRLKSFVIIIFKCRTQHGHLIAFSGAMTIADVRVWGDPAGAKAMRRLPGLPTESGSPGAAN